MSSIESDVEKVKEKYFTKPFIILYIMITFILVNLQYFYYFYTLFILGVDITTSNLTIINSVKNNSLSIFPIFNIGLLVNSLGVICGSYLGFESVFKITKTIQLEKGLFYVDEDKEKFFRKLIFIFTILFVEVVIANIIIGKFYDVAYNETLFWFSFLLAEYVFGKKGNKALANVSINSNEQEEQKKNECETKQIDYGKYSFN